MIRNKATFTQNWFEGAIPVLEYSLKALKDKENLNFLEIGSFEGKSTIWFLENILRGNGSNITCIDNFTGNNEWNAMRVSTEGLKDRFLANMKPYVGKYKLIEGDSAKILRKKFEDNTFDLVYIDGSHEAHSTLLDAIYSYPLLKDGAYIIFDDYMWNFDQLPDHRTPKIAIDSFMSCMKGKVKAIQISWKTVVLRKVS